MRRLSTPRGTPTRTVLARMTLALAALVGTTGLAACSSASGNEAAVRDDGTVDLSKVTLTVGDQKGGSQALLKAAGAIGKTPYTVQWKSFTSGPPLLEALNAGAIDLGGVGNTPPLFAAAAKSKLEVVSGATMGAKGDTIVVPKGSDVTSVADLKGKKVAVAEGSSANYDLLAQLDRAGLPYGDVEVQNLQPADALGRRRVADVQDAQRVHARHVEVRRAAGEDTGDRHGPGHRRLEVDVRAGQHRDVLRLGVAGAEGQDRRVGQGGQQDEREQRREGASGHRHGGSNARDAPFLRRSRGPGLPAPAQDTSRSRPVSTS